jgi:hypothetical protein
MEEHESTRGGPVTVTVELRVSYPIKGPGSQLEDGRADVVSAICAQVNTLLPLTDWTGCMMDQESLLLKVTPEGQRQYRLVLIKESLAEKKG